jgi:hypothetical protein
MGGVAAALSVGTLAVKSFNAAADQESTISAFKTLLGSLEKAKTLAAELTRFADVTPFEPEPVLSAGRALLAFGFAQERVIPTLTMLGDVASGLKIPLEELVDVYGRNIVQGRLFARDIYQFQSRGIPIISALAKVLKVADSEVLKMVENGMVGTDQLEKAFLNLTAAGGKFAGGMAEQARTVNGLMSTLRGYVTALFREFGTPVNSALKPMIESSIALVKGLGPMAADFGTKVAGALNLVTDLFKSGTLLETIQLALSVGFGKGVNALVGYLRGAVTGFIMAMGAGLTAIFGVNFWKIFLAGANMAILKLGAIMLTIFKTPVDYIAAGLKVAMQHVINAGESMHEMFGKAANVIVAGVIYAGAQLKNLLASIPSNPFGMEKDGRSYDEVLAAQNRRNPVVSGASEVDSFGVVLAEQEEAGNALVKQLEAKASMFAKATGGLLKEALPDAKEVGKIIGEGFRENSAPANVVDVSAEEAKLRSLKADADKRVDAAKAAAPAAPEKKNPFEKFKTAFGKSRLETASLKSGGLTTGGLDAAVAAGQGSGSTLKAPSIIADSLAKMGGGGNVAIGASTTDPLLRETQSQTTELKAIRKAVENRGGDTEATLPP